MSIPTTISCTGIILAMTYKMTKTKYKPNPVPERALGLLYILPIDHEKNCSAQAMRSVGSSWVDPDSAMAGAAAALFGSSHGDANESVLKMLGSIGIIKNTPAFIARVKHSEGKLMGFGHQVYKNLDPRGKIIKKLAEQVFAIMGCSPLIDIALGLERMTVQDDYIVSRKLYANIDFCSEIIYQALNIRMAMFPVMFAIPRTSGWLAQGQELVTDPD